MFPRVPRVNHDMKQNAGVTCADGEGSEADCYTVLIHNLCINSLWHTKFCTLTALNDKDLLVNSILYVWCACLAVLVRVGGLRKSMEIRLLRRRCALRGAGCRLAGDVIRVWKIRITQTELYKWTLTTWHSPHIELQSAVPYCLDVTDKLQQYTHQLN